MPRLCDTSAVQHFDWVTYSLAVKETCDAEQLRQSTQRNGLPGESDRLENREASVKALNKWDLSGLLRWHMSEITPRISLRSTSNKIVFRRECGRLGKGQPSFLDSCILCFSSGEESLKSRSVSDLVQMIDRE
jgi:hypothetical protein